MLLSVREYVSEYVFLMIFTNMDPVRGLLPTGTLTKKFSQTFRTEKKSMHKLGLGNTGIGRDPFSDPFRSHFFELFTLFFLKFMLVGSGKTQL